jgi:N-acetyl-anhydromuramyl-L-alanine amidase AmpD
MNIEKCFLDYANGYPVDGATIGSLIAASGKRHLWDERRDGRIDTIVIHYMSAVAVDPARPYDMGRILRIFCDCGVSSHYLITRRGKIFSLVPEEAKAWHAGQSVMPEPDNRTGVNEFSIGIELAAAEDSGFTKLQYGALGRLCRDIMGRYGIKMAIVGHDMIAGERAVAMGLRKEPKIDPGPLFDWGFIEKIAFCSST